MLKHFDKNENESLIFELTEGRNAGMIGGYCEEGFPLNYANEKMANMLGYDTVAEMATGIDGMVANTIHPEDYDACYERLRCHQVHKEPGGTARRQEHSYYRHDSQCLCR